MRLKSYITEKVNIKKAMERAWGESAKLGQFKIVYKYDTGGAWLILAKHLKTKKYYGINYLDEVIEKTTKVKAAAWASDFSGEDVKIKE